MERIRQTCTPRLLPGRRPASRGDVRPLAAAPRPDEAPRADEPAALLRESRGTCGEPSLRALLLRYSADAGTRAQRAAFEHHLMTCDECVDDLVAVWRVSDLLDSRRAEAAGRPLPVVPDLVRAARTRRRLVGVAAALAAAALGFAARGLV